MKTLNKMNNTTGQFLKTSVLIAVFVFVATFVPLTALAQHYSPTNPPPVAAKGYIVLPIGANLYWLSNGTQHSIFLVYDKGVVAVDAPIVFQDFHLKAIAETTDKPVTHLIYSHAHTDHIGAADGFPSNTVRIAQEETKGILVRTKDSRRPPPNVTFKDNYTLRVGAEVLQLDYKGPNHLKGNIFIYAPRQKVLVLMDFLFTDNAYFPELGYPEDVPGMMRHFDYALAYDFQTFISGHVARAATRDDLKLNQQYLNDLRDNADAALQKITIPRVAQSLGKQAEGNTMLVIRTYLEAVARETERLQLLKWKGKLPGIEATTFYNALRMIQSRRVD